MKLRIRLAAPILLLALSVSARGDVLVLANGRKLVGGVHRESADSVAYNPTFSRDPAMVFDVQVFPRSQVKEVIRRDPPVVTFLEKLGALAADDVAGRVELARWAEDQKLGEEADFALRAALRIDPANEAAEKAFGKSKFRRIARGNPDFDPEARAAIADYLKLGDPAERKKAYGQLKRDHSVDLPREYLDRILRSRAQATGLQKDRPLSLRASENPGVYTLFVPKNYDPARAWPLVIGLHGGGPGGKDRDAVVGSGDSAMNFYIQEATARGYIVACPNALTTPWSAPKNAPFLRSVIDEVELLYDIDLNRVYLTGHSMGGFGCWYYGPKWAEEFAAISPMAGGGGESGVPRLVETNTPVFVYHGADDGVVPPGSDRAAARLLEKTDLDFVYTEIDGIGHGFPESIRKYLFDFFDTRRLAVMHGRRAGPPSVEVRSSFLAKVTRDEVRYLGDPTGFAAGGAAGSEGWKDLVKDLGLGGGRAEEAARALGELKAPESVKPVSDLLRHPGTPDDVKIRAAEALGAIGDADGYPGLASALRSENPEVVAAAAAAMGRIPGEKPGEALLASLPWLSKCLVGKRLGDHQIHVSDWDRWLSAFDAVVAGLGEKKPNGAAAAIRDTVVRGVLAAGYDVIYSKRAGQDPAISKHRLALTSVRAVAAIGGDSAADVLGEIEAACPGDAEVTAACRGAK